MNPPTTNGITASEIQAHFDANDRFGMVGFMGRVGFSKFMTRLEHEHYDPKNDELNARYQMFLISHQGLMFVVISIPLEDRHLAEKIATECDLRFGNGVPTFISSNGVVHFPIQHKNLWLCENLPTSGVYKGKTAELEAEEQRWLNNFWAKKEAELAKDQ